MDGFGSTGIIPKYDEGHLKMGYSGNCVLGYQYVNEEDLEVMSGLRREPRLAKRPN